MLRWMLIIFLLAAFAAGVELQGQTEYTIEMQGKPAIINVSIITQSDTLIKIIPDSALEPYVEKKEFIISDSSNVSVTIPKEIPKGSYSLVVIVQEVYGAIAAGHMITYTIIKDVPQIVIGSSANESRIDIKTKEPFVAEVFVDGVFVIETKIENERRFILPLEKGEHVIEVRSEYGTVNKSVRIGVPQVFVSDAVKEEKYQIGVLFDWNVPMDVKIIYPDGRDSKVMKYRLVPGRNELFLPQISKFVVQFDSRTAYVDVPNFEKKSSGASTIVLLLAIGYAVLILAWMILTNRQKRSDVAELLKEWKEYQKRFHVRKRK